MILIGLDCETFPTRPGLAAPPLVCISFALQDGRTDLKNAEDGLDEVEELLKDPRFIFVTHNGFYDWSVFCAARPRLIPLVFQAFADNRMRDTLIRAKLIAIAQGKLKEDSKRKDQFTLETLCREQCGLVLEKDDEIRLTYAQYAGLPVSRYSEKHVRYAKLDALAPLRLYEAQEDQASDYCQPDTFPHAVWNESHECRAAWALQLMRVHGVRTDKAAIDKLEAELLTDFNKVDAIVRAGGLVRTAGHNELVRTKKKGVVTERWKTIPLNKDGSKNMALIHARVVAAYAAKGLPPPMTEPDHKTGKGGGNISTEAEVLEDSGDPLLEALAERGGYEKVLTTYIPALRKGEKYALNAYWNVLVSSTRTSCGDPNLQNPPRKAGVRECIIARVIYEEIDVTDDYVLQAGEEFVA